MRKSIFINTKDTFELSYPDYVAPIMKTLVKVLKIRRIKKTELEGLKVTSIIIDEYANNL